jgi:predicted O-linked N-acetylglucosamine transferase (SPINDLY family)
LGEQDFEQAKAAFGKGDLDRTFQIVTALMARDGASDARLLPLLADAFLASDMPGEAVEALEQAAISDPAQSATLRLKALSICEKSGLADKSFLLAMQLVKQVPDNADAIYALIKACMRIGETDVVDHFKNRLVASDNLDHLRLAIALIGNDLMNENNLVLFKKLSSLVPDDPNIRFALMGFAREFGDLETLEREQGKVNAQLAAGEYAFLKYETPHYSLMWCGNEALNRLAVNTSIMPDFAPGLPQKRRLKTRTHAWGRKLHIGYLSSDFWDDHATMRLFQSVLKAHEPNQFEITLFCYTPERFLAMDGGNRSKWGTIIRIADQDDETAARTIINHHVDILVDLKGFTGGARPALMNRMIAPVQVAWLGFPGSAVNVDCDYIIGDRFTLPDSAKPHYHEKFVRLPDTYQPNDPVFRALPAPSSRQALGLPEDRIVLAAFNTVRKITPETFDLWLQILKRADNTVLWLMCDSEIGRAAMAARALRQGLAADRLIFARKTDYHSHIARLQAADLGLDTFPYNGHTTTSDQLWAGLPVMTKRGTNFASRVSESLLNAIGLSELVADNASAFVDLAVSLCGDKAEIQRLKDHLNANRRSAPLFDAGRFCLNLEKAFVQMADRAKAGLDPEHMDVI